LPAVPWHAVLASLVAGALTHLLWDGLTRDHGAQTHSINWLQHASTLVGTLVLAWWLWRQLRGAPLAPTPEPEISPAARAWVWALLLAVAAASAGWSAYDWPAMNLDLATLRKIARMAASAALQGFAVAALLCCAAWKLR
jgi:membrane associated rhomboid family serine protease